MEVLNDFKKSVPMSKVLSSIIEISSQQMRRYPLQAHIH